MTASPASAISATTPSTDRLVATVSSRTTGSEASRLTLSSTLRSPPIGMDTSGTAAVTAAATAALTSTDSSTTETETETSNNVLALPADDFEEIMRQRTKMRRQREDAVTAELRTKVGRLEAALAAETKRRVTAIQSLHQDCTAQLQASEERLMSKIDEDRETAAARFGALEERLQVLQEQWQTDLQQTETALVVKSTAVAAQVDDIRAAATREHVNRQQREQTLLQQLEHWSQQTAEQLAQERQERLNQTAILTGRLDDQDRARESMVHEYTNKLRAELTNLQEELQQESAVRQYQDEDIVAALNRYTAQLQTSLSFIASDV